MLERIVENWLTSASERTFEVPFTQLLASEGHQVLQGPVHHAFEQGKDIITLNDDGELCAHQLKNGGGQLRLGELREHQDQLTTLSRSAVSIPALPENRQPDRVFFVTNRTLTPPARDLVQQLSEANRGLDYPGIELVEKDSLLGRFVAGHGDYFPSEPEDISSFLQLFLSDGKGELRAEPLLQFLEHLLPFEDEDVSVAECERAAAAAALFTAYALAPWTRRENHLEIARGWLFLASQILRLAATHDVEADAWEDSYNLAYQAARVSLQDLLEEAADREDLVVPGITESLVYGVRALRVCGACAALLLSEELAGHDHSLRADVRTLLNRECLFMGTMGEAGAPLVFLVAWAFGELGNYALPVSLISGWASDLVRGNHPSSEEGIPDPYHSVREVQLARLTSDHTFLDEEQFTGKSYTFHIAVEWLARRLFRQTASSLWPGATRIDQMEHWPRVPDGFFRYRDPNAQLQMGRFPVPTSWSELISAANKTNRNHIPDLLWERPELLPLLLLVFPHRFTSSYAGALDHLLTGAGELVDPDEIQQQEDEEEATEDQGE